MNAEVIEKAKQNIRRLATDLGLVFDDKEVVFCEDENNHFVFLRSHKVKVFDKYRRPHRRVINKQIVWLELHNLRRNPSDYKINYDPILAPVLFSQIIDGQQKFPLLSCHHAS